MTEQENENTERYEAALTKRTVITDNEPIKLDCELPGHKGEFVLFYRDGWTFRKLCEYEEAETSRRTEAKVAEMIVDWSLTDGAGKPVTFAPAEIRKEISELEKRQNTEASIKLLKVRLETAYASTFDDLQPSVMSFLFTAYRTAYMIAGALPPKR